MTEQLPSWPTTPPAHGPVVLREFTDDDAHLALELGNDPYIPLIGSLPALPTPQQALEWIRRQRGRHAEGIGLSFAIADAESNNAVGAIGLWLQNISAGCATIGYSVSPAHRGRGIASSALKALTTFAWTIPALHRIELYIEPWNNSSIHVAEASGYQREGLLRSHEEIGGTRRDMLLYATTRLSENAPMERQSGTKVLTRSSLAGDLRRLGLADGDAVMIHAAFRRVGTVLGGPDALVDAVLDVIGADGTLLSYQDWELSTDVWDDDGRVLDALRDHVPPFDPATARPARDHGIVAATIGTRPGVRRSGNPGASVAAIGARAEEFTVAHSLDFGYGENSPFARLVAAGGRVLMVGAPLDTMTLLHHAEHLADLPDKRRVHIEYPLATSTGTEWHIVEEYDTSVPVVAGPPDDYFRLIVDDYLATGAGHHGNVGAAHTVLVDAAGVTAFAVAWLEDKYGR